MLRLALDAPVRRKAEVCEEDLREGPLFFEVEMSVEEGIIRGRLFPEPFDQRKEPFTEESEETVIFLKRHPGLIFQKHRLVE